MCNKIALTKLEKSHYSCDHLLSKNNTCKWVQRDERDQKGIWTAVEKAVLISDEEFDSKAQQRKFNFPKELGLR